MSLKDSATPPAQPATRIPFTRAAVMGRELDYVAEAIRSHKISGDGQFTKRCRDWLEKRFDLASAHITTSCTHALEMAALLLDCAPGDEIILPSFTFVSTANAFALRGATLRFADSRPDTLNIDETRLEELITPRTRAIVVVHYAGIACEMARIMELAKAHDIDVVEDNAHGLCGKYRGKWLGTFGALSTASFHDTKNFTCGEGGALMVNDAAYTERAEIIREKGTDRSRFFRGQVDKYTWRDIGSSYLPSEILTAFLLGQLESEAAIQANRRRAWESYHRELRSWAARHGVTLPVVPTGCEPSWHLYWLMLPSLEERRALIAHLDAQDIGAVFHYQPLHLSEMGKRLGTGDARLPVAEAAGDRLLRLPMYNDMSEANVARVLEAVTSWR